MDLLVIFLLALCIIATIAAELRNLAATSPLKAPLNAQTAAVGLYALLSLGRAGLDRLGSAHAAANLGPILDLTLAVGGTFGLSIINYVNTGRIRRGFHLLALLALLPHWGHILAVALWIFIPIMAFRTSRSIPDVETQIKIQTIFCGSMGGALLLTGLIIYRLQGIPPMNLEVVGALASLLFLYAGLHTPRDPEHEFIHGEVRLLVRSGLLAIIVLSLAPPLLLNGSAGTILHNFLMPAFLLAAVVFLVILAMHFESLGIRTFLSLIGIAFLPIIVQHLYHDRLEDFLRHGLVLLSRTALVLACLFVLKQYMRWGFEIAQTMVMVITAIASAAIVLLVIYTLQPPDFSARVADFDLLIFGVRILDMAVLLCLPPILVNYRFGTMKVTWAILSFGFFFLVYADFLPWNALRYERDIAETLSYGLFLLAFATLWRYSSAMIRQIRAYAGEEAGT